MNKDCEYCNEIVLRKSFLNWKPSDGQYLHLDGVILGNGNLDFTIISPDEVYVIRQPIKYCPMCGRKLANEK